MATTPTATIPAFQRVQQSNDFDDAFACIATLTGKTLAEVRQVAIDKLKHPKYGPYWITEDLIKKLFAYFGLIATPYKEFKGTISELAPDVALLMIEYNVETEIGRHVVFYRSRTTSPKGVTETVIDPAYWVDPAKQILTDLKALQASWWMGVHPAGSSGK